MRKSTVSFLSLSFSFFIAVSSLWATSTPSILTYLALPVGHALNAVDWKVGDYSNYKLDLGFFQGTVHKKVTSDEGEALWIKTEAKTPLTSQVVKTLIRKSDGKILRMIVNDQEQKVEEPDIEIITQKAATVTVPAGTFKVIYLKVKERKQNAIIEVWINPVEVPMGGDVKSVVQQSGMTATISLTDFGRGLN